MTNKKNALELLTEHYSRLSRMQTVNILQDLIESMRWSYYFYINGNLGGTAEQQFRPYVG